MHCFSSFFIPFVYTYTLYTYISYIPQVLLSTRVHSKAKPSFTLEEFQACCSEAYGDGVGPDSTKYMLNISPCLSSIKPNRTRHLFNVNYTLMCFMDWGLDYLFDYN